MSIHDLTADREILITAAELMRRVIAIENHYFHLDSYAALLFRSGQLVEGKNGYKKPLKEVILRELM